MIFYAQNKSLPLLTTCCHNNDEKVLFICRNDKWDLPKGKVEIHESIEEGAIREVEEETGVSGLVITKPLSTTYHIFKRNGRYKIKITYWFKMHTTMSLHGSIPM